MRKSLLTLFALALLLPALCVPALATERDPVAGSIPGCSFTRYANFIVTADTLWFTKAAPNANAALFTAQKADWFKPASMPVTDQAGNLTLGTKRVKSVQMYSRQPFSVRVFYPTALAQDGVLETGSVFVYADSLGRSNALNSKLERFPCVVTIEGYPDSIRVKETGSDTVRVRLGYQ